MRQKQQNFTTLMGGANMYNALAAQHYDKRQGPVFFEPYAIEIAGRIKPSAANVVLEIACGTGRVTRHLRNSLSPASRLIATDLSPDMMDVAKENLNNSNIEWQIADAQELPFEDNSVDLIVCAFGYMFVPDKVKAFAEARRVLRPGGKLLFTTWGQLEENAAPYVHRKVVKKHLGELPAQFMYAFLMNDEVEIGVWLQKAGFSDINFETVEKIAEGSSAKEVADGLAMNGAFYDYVVARNPGLAETIKSEIEEVLTEKYGAKPMKCPMLALFTTAIKNK
jgi:ubiquinone/menaquinone biosynthesis C-methylase UbiE